MMYKAKMKWERSLLDCTRVAENHASTYCAKSGV